VGQPKVVEEPNEKQERTQQQQQQQQQQLQQQIINMFPKYKNPTLKPVQ